MKDLDFTDVMRRLADKRIEDAMAEGKFDNLPGAGQPLHLEPLPADENARAMWWAIRLMKNANVTPDEVRHRKTIDQLKGRLAAADTEGYVRQLVQQVNAIVRKLNALGVRALGGDERLLDEERQVERFRQRTRR